MARSQTSVQDIIKAVAQMIGIETAVEAFVNDHDPSISLPTGYGKSVIYAVLPGTFDPIRGTLAHSRHINWIRIGLDNWLPYIRLQMTLNILYMKFSLVVVYKAALI